MSRGVPICIAWQNVMITNHNNQIIKLVLESLYSFYAFVFFLRLLNILTFLTSFVCTTTTSQERKKATVTNSKSPIDEPRQLAGLQNQRAADKDGIFGGNKKEAAPDCGCRVAGVS